MGITPILQVLLGSSFQAFCSTFGSVAIGWVVAHCCYMYQLPGVRLLLCTAPVFALLPTKLCALSIELATSTGGFLSIVLAHILMNGPFAFYIIYHSYTQISREQMLTAYHLGASEWQFFRTVLLSALVPTVENVAVLIFILCFSCVGIPLMLGNSLWCQTLDTFMSNAYQQHDVISVLVAGVVRILFFLFVLNSFSLYTRSPSMQSGIRQKCNVPQRIRSKVMACFGVTGVLALFFFPIMRLFEALFVGGGLQFLASTCTTNSSLLPIPLWKIVCNSLVIAFLSSIGSVCLALVSVILIYNQTSKIRFFGDVSAAFPFMCGSVGIGIFFNTLVAKISFFPQAVLVCSHIFLNYPFAYRMIRSHVLGFPNEFLLLAQSAGANWLLVCTTVLVPYFLPVIRWAFIVTFCLSMVEVGAASVSRTDTITLIQAIKILRAAGHTQGVYGLSILLLATLFFAVFIGTNKRG